MTKYGTLIDNTPPSAVRVGGAEAWAALLDGAAQALGKTSAEIDEFLAQIPQEA